MKLKYILITLFIIISLSSCSSKTQQPITTTHKLDLGLKDDNCFKTRHLLYDHNKLYEVVKLLFLRSKFKIISSNQANGMITSTGHIIINDNGEEKIIYIMNSIIIKKMDNISYMMIDSSYQTKKFIPTQEHLKENQISFKYPLKFHKSQLKIGSFGSNNYNGFYRMFYLNIYQAMFENEAKYYNDKY